MKSFINFIRSDKIILRGTLISLALLTLHLLTLLFFYRLLPPLVPVYNQLPWGTERLGGRFELFIPFFIAAALILINIILMKLWYSKSPLLSRILGVTTLLINILAIIFSMRIIQLII